MEDFLGIALGSLIGGVVVYVFARVFWDKLSANKHVRRLHFIQSPLHYAIFVTVIVFLGAALPEIF